MYGHISYIIIYLYIFMYIFSYNKFFTGYEEDYIKDYKCLVLLLLYISIHNIEKFIINITNILIIKYETC